MYCVELYVGFSDKTWDIVTIDTPEEEDPEVWSLAYFHENFSKQFHFSNKAVAFVGIYHIHHMETTE